MHNFRSLGLVSSFLAVFCFPLAALAVSGPTLKEVRLSTQHSRAQVEVIADSPLTYTYYRMPDLLKVAIDLALVDPGQVNRVVAGSGLISKITVEKKDITTFSLTRLLIDLQSDADFTVHPDAADRSRLLVTFSPKKNEATAEKEADRQEKDRDLAIAPPATAVAELPAPIPVAVTPPVAAIPAPPAAETDPAPAKEEPKVTSMPRRVLEPVVPEPGPARSINEIKVSKRAVEIKATARLDDYKAFTLKKPARLVIDVPMSKTPLAAKEIPLKRFGVSKARVGNYPDKVRMVFDADGATFPPYRIERSDKGLAVVFAPKGGK